MDAVAETEGKLNDGNRPRSNIGSVEDQNAG